jgi:hypothetical protein
MDVGRLRIRLAPALLLAMASGCASVMGPTTATSFMRIIERSPDPNARFKAYQSLASPGAYDDNEQRARAARLLVTKLDPKAEPLASRAMICRTLGELGDPVARDAMVRLSGDPDPLIRAEAYRSLGKVGRREDATVLMRAMTLDLDEHCKAAAAEALGSLRDVDPRTEPYLVRALENDDPRIRFAALQSLRKLSKKDLGAKPEPWRDYVLAKYGEKIEPTTVADANGQPARDPAAAPASMSPASPRLGPQSPPGAAWNRTSTTPEEADAPYLNAMTGTAPTPPSNPGQAPLPAPPPAGPRGIINKIFGY